MGLTKNGNAGAIFLSVSDGKLIRGHKAPIEGVTESRVNKNGKTVHEEKFRDVSGTLKFLSVIENDYGKQWVATLVDGEDTFIVNIPHASRYATSLLKVMPNVNLDKPLRLMPWTMADSRDPSKKVTGITVYQDGKKIEAAYTKESPNGLPQMQQVKFKGAMVWDSSDMDDFLESMVRAKFGAVDTPAPVDLPVVPSVAAVAAAINPPF